jgi:hypothetical protein
VSADGLQCAAVEAGPRRGRGRPALAYDNKRVRAFLQMYDTLPELVRSFVVLDDVFTGAAAAQSEGQASTRPLSKHRIFAVLAHCGSISTREVEDALRWQDYSRTAIARYAAAARTASMVIARLLDQAPHWEDGTWA